MKTLDQIEARTPIVSAGNTINISSPGSYYLLADATFVGNGIVITSDNVTIDLNGFTLNGFGIGTGKGIVVSGSHRNVVIRNGTVRNFGGGGIDAFTGTSCKLDQLHVSDNKAAGAVVSDDSIVTRCTFNANSTDGLQARSGCIVKECTASGNGADGIAGFAIVVENCAARGNNSPGAFGIRANGQSQILRCKATGNNGADGGGIAADSGGVIRECVSTSNAGGTGIFGGDVIDSTASNNGKDGIATTGSAQIIGNTVENNGTGAVVGPGYGIRVEGFNSRVENNTAIFNESGGIRVNAPATGNLIIKNTSHGHTAGNNYNIATGNRVAPIVAVPPTANPATEGGPATSVGTDNPWANFSY